MMKKVFLLTLALLFTVSAVFAGGILTNTNQSARFIRLVAIDASTSIDAAYSNPAGLTKLKDGFHFSFTNQSAFQTRTINTTFAPFVGFGGNETKKFKGTASAPIVPSLQGAYKKDKWVISGSIAVTGGGGKATFNHGLPSFEAQIATIPGKVQGLASALDPTFSCNQYSVDSYMNGSSFIYGAQLGGSYAASDMFSLYGGFRLNIVNNKYEGNLRNIMINPKSANPALGSGAMIPASHYFRALAEVPALAGYKDVLEQNAVATEDKYLDCSQSGWGISPIIGLNFSYEKLNIGVKYEFRTTLNVENKTKVDNTGLFANGVNTPHDIPALFTIGASYEVLPKLMANIGYHHFFDSEAEMANDKQKYISGGTDEYLMGFEYKVNDMFLLSAGGQITRYGVKDDYQTDLSFSLNSYSIGLGGAVNVSKNVVVNIGYFWTDYSDWTKTKADYQGTGTAGTDVFSRTNKVFAAGVDFSF